MEEILASIRRIISEDDAPADTGEATPPAAVEAAPAEEEPPVLTVVEPEPEPATVFAEDDDDVLELTERVEPEPEPEPEALLEPAARHSIGDLDVVAPVEARAPAPAPRAAVMSAPDDEDSLMSAPAADEAASAFGQLARTVLMPAEGHTLEDVVREMLKPLLKDWLDRNLPSIVEAQVQAEVERISRRRI